MDGESMEEWPALLERKRKEIRDLHRDFNKTRHLRTRELFWEEVDKEAEAYKQRDRVNLFYTLRQSYKNLEAFIKTASCSSTSIRKEQLEVLIFRISFMAIKRALRPPSQYEALVISLEYLNNNMPKFKGCDEPLPDVPWLQQPLQKIYQSYIDYYLDLLRLMIGTEPLSDQSQRHHAIETIKSFRSEEKNYEVLLRVHIWTRDIGSHEKARAQLEAHFTEVDGGLLGKGAYGKVYEIRENATGARYALKVLPIGGSSRPCKRENIKEEIKVMRKLSHHHIANIAFSTADSAAFRLYIHPLADCDLRQYLDRNTEPNIDQVSRWFGCLVSALAYTHANDVKHRDIKPENILIAEGGARVLLADFGLALDFSQTGHATTRGGKYMIGTERYLAPECTSGGKRSLPVDVFAMGCVYAELLWFITLDSNQEDQPPWSQMVFRDCLPEARKRIEERFRLPSQRKSTRKVPRTINDDVFAITYRMLDGQAEQRPQAYSIALELQRLGLHCSKCYLKDLDSELKPDPPNPS